MSKITYIEQTHNGKIYKIRVSSNNAPSESAIENCNILVNDIMNQAMQNT